MFLSAAAARFWASFMSTDACEDLRQSAALSFVRFLRLRLEAHRGLPRRRVARVHQVAPCLLRSLSRACGRVVARLRKAPRKATAPLSSKLMRPFMAPKAPLEHKDPEDVGVVIIATGGRSFSLLFATSAERPGRPPEASMHRRRRVCGGHDLCGAALAPGDGRGPEACRPRLALRSALQVLSKRAVRFAATKHLARRI